MRFLEYFFDKKNLTKVVKKQWDKAGITWPINDFLVG